MYEACLKILCFDYVNIVTGGQPINNKHISISISISLPLLLTLSLITRLKLSHCSKHSRVSTDETSVPEGRSEAEPRKNASIK